MSIVAFYAFLFNILCINQNALQTFQKYWLQRYSLQVLDAAVLPVYKVFSVWSYII